MTAGDEGAYCLWPQSFAEKAVSAEEAVAHIKPGQRVFIGTGCAEPQALVRAMCARKRELAGVEIVHLLTLGEAPYATREFSEYFTVNSFFIAENVRGIIQEGLGDYTPIFLSDIPALFDSGRLPLDVALIQTTPPDERGMMSLGVSVDIVKSAAANASLVIAQVNPRMPRTLGNSFIAIDDVDIVTLVDEPIIEWRTQPPGEDSNTIGARIAGLIEDGATVEVGIGDIPQATLLRLTGKKDLGIHTEMITDTIVDLVDSGAVTGARKSVDTGRITASFLVGTKKLYDRVHNNPLFSINPTEYVNDPVVISRQYKMTAINTALEVDLTGQVCADSLGPRFFSGIGGQVDFNRGAARSPGGKAIIALPSTAMDGAVSRIVSQLTPGAGVVTTRGDVHYLVTEHGVAYLHGKSVKERAMALIGVAHPKFRQRLLEEAIALKYLRPEKSKVGQIISSVSEEAGSALILNDGTQVSFRSVKLTDESAMKDLLYALSQQTIYYRFMSGSVRFPPTAIQDFVFIDHRKDVCIVGAIQEAEGDKIVAVGRYYLDQSTNRAEVAFVIRDEWQGRGLGKFMFRQLATIARRNGITGFTAETLAENKRMQTIFYHCGLKVKSQMKEGVVSFIMDF